MSGIVGIVGSGASLQAMRRQLRGLDARGPTAAWEVSGNGFALGAVAAGATPGGARAAIASGWAVALDGELSNAGALIRELEFDESGGSAGTTATLVSQTGVQRALGRMAGDVGLAAINVETGFLVLARGALGLRPLFVVVTPHGVVFSTNARSLQRLVATPPSIEAMSQYVSLGCTVPPRSDWEGVRAIAPGTWLEFGGDGVREFRWTELEQPVRTGRGNRERFVRSVHYALDGAVRSTVAAAGPWALGLSGGNASAAILACRPPSLPPAVAFTLYAAQTDGSQSEGAEVAAASATAKAAGIPWKSVKVSVDDIEALLDEAPADAALVSPDAIAWHALARAAWQEGLSGLALGVGASAGFDPPALVGGLAGLTGRLRERAPLSFPRGRLALPFFGASASTENAAENAAAVVSAMPGDAQSPGWDAFVALVAAAPSQDETLLQGWLCDRLWLPERSLRAVDQACSAWGLSAALPFADPALIRVARLVPSEVHHAGGRCSVLADLVTAAGGTPAARTFPSFVPPIREWLLRGKVIEESIESMSDLLDGDHIRALVERVVAGDAHATRRVWAITMLARWRAAALAAG